MSVSRTILSPNSGSTIGAEKTTVVLHRGRPIALKGRESASDRRELRGAAQILVQNHFRERATKGVRELHPCVLWARVTTECRGYGDQRDYRRNQWH